MHEDMAREIAAARLERGRIVAAALRRVVARAMQAGTRMMMRARPQAQPVSASSTRRASAAG
jgi:hypothetical protein